LEEAELKPRKKRGKELKKDWEKLNIIKIN
jgi:hypothetical protein